MNVFQEAKKYSFLNKGSISVYEQKIDFAELSDFDLYVGSPEYCSKELD